MTADDKYEYIYNIILLETQFKTNFLLYCLHCIKIVVGTIRIRNDIKILIRTKNIYFRFISTRD